MVVATRDPAPRCRCSVDARQEEKTLNVTVDELDLEAETGNARAQRPAASTDDPEQEASSGFGMYAAEHHA